MRLLKLNLKKNLKIKKANNPEKTIYFFDESRFGTHSKHGLGWFKKGSRTSVFTKLGYKSFYVYSAVTDKDGDSFSLIMPYVNKECMQIFIDRFGDNIKGKVILVMDRAGWHKGLILPEKIEIVYLPAYSPELNPAEKLWQYIKDNVLKNQVYERLKLLEDKVCQFICDLSQDKIKSLCHCSYV